MFSYDVASNMITANNHDARISRTYFPNGGLQTDTLSIRAYGSTIASPFNQHLYGLEMTYDLSGRRISLKHPSLTATWSCGACSQSYSYDPQMGALSAVTDVFGNSYGFTYDGRSRLTQATAPGSVVRNWAFDVDDRMTSRIDVTGSVSGQLHHDSLEYDARGKVIHAMAGFNPGLSYDYLTAYSGQGAIVYSSRSKNGTYPTIEQMNVDGYGNMVSHRTYTDVVNQHTQNIIFGFGSERVTKVGDDVVLGQAYSGAPVDTVKTSFDPAGNTVLYSVHRSAVVNGSGGPTTTRVSDLGSASYYGADEKLRVYSRVGTPTSRETRAVFEEYRYDALGRRVLLRSQADSSQPSYDALALSHIERFVWDGNQLLYEVRQPGQHSLSEAQLEAESLYGTSPPVFFGTVGYTHGAALDRPLSLIRNGQVIVPHAGFRGEYDTGTLTNGTAASTDIDWPGNEISTYSEDNWTASKGWAGSLIRDKRDESGLKFMRNRYYDARTGRFTQEDPIGLAGGMNLYGFAGGDPVNFSDPFGLSPDCATLPCPVVFGGLVAGGPAGWFAIGVIGITLLDDAFGSHGGAAAFSERAGADATAYKPGGRFSGKTKGQIDRDATAATGKSGTCEYCGITLVPVPGSPTSTEYDHQKAKSKGGDNSPENGRRSCRTCNREKGADDVPDPRKPTSPEE